MIKNKTERAKKLKEREKSKLKSVRARIKDEKGLLTDREVFKSISMNEYLSKKVNRVLTGFHLSPVKVECHWLPKYEDFVAATDNHKIEINAAHKLLKGKRPERLEKVMGLSAHESAHILFTNFTEHFARANSIGAGKLYPAPLGVPSELKANENALYEFLDGKNPVDPSFPKESNRYCIQSVDRNIANILEDARIENLFSEYCYGHKSLYGGLITLLKEQSKQCKTLDEILEEIRTGERLEFEGMLSIMLHYARFGELKGYIHKKHKDENFVKSFFKIKPYCDKYIGSTSTSEALSALNMILITLFSEIEEYVRKIQDEQNKNPGSGNAPNEISKRGGSIPGMTPGHNINNSEGIEKSLESSSPSSSKTEDESDPGESSSSASEADGDEQPDADQSYDILEERAKESGEVTKSCYRKNSKIASDLKGEGRTENTTLTQEKTNTNLDLDSIETGLAKERTTEEDARRISEDLKELKDDIDFGSIHEGVNSKIIRHNVTEQNKADYDNIAPALVKIAKRMARKADYFMEDTSPLEVKGKYSGKRFNAAAVSKGDYKYFSRDYALEPAPRVAIGIRVDESGSMQGARAQAAKATALLIYTFCHLTGVKLAIYGDDTSRGVNIYCYTDFESYDDEDDKYRLCNISAGGCNRDGYAIRYLKERLAEVEADKKLMIIISDGQPSDSGYYGTAALADIQNICKECDREGIGYIAAAIGADKEDIKTIYGERHFLDISDLNSLPEKLTGLIRRLLK